MPEHITISTAEKTVEDLIADLQEWRAGLRKETHEHFASRVAAVLPEAKRLKMAGFLSSLLRSSNAPDISHLFLDLDVDTQQRKYSYQCWRDQAWHSLPKLWSWIQKIRSQGDWTGWWYRDLKPVPHQETVERMRSILSTVKPIGPIAKKWAKQAECSNATAEYQWRWLCVGKGIRMTMPSVKSLLRSLVSWLRTHALLPLHHNIQMVCRPSNRPYMVMPVKVPGKSILFVSSSVPPITIQYIFHELGHLVEHALRPHCLPLVERWRFDIVRSEGIALLFEYLLQDPLWLERLGFAADDSRRLARFLREEETFTKGLFTADIALDKEVGAAKNLEEALFAADKVAKQLEIEWDPAIMLFRLPGMINWRAYMAAWLWRHTVITNLVQRFGNRWMDKADSWKVLHNTISSVGTASDILSMLEVGVR